MFKLKRSNKIFIVTLIGSIIVMQYMGIAWANGVEIEKAITTTKVNYDLDDDGRVNTNDLLMVANDYNFHSDNINFNVNVDFNKDNIIDIYDLTLMGNAFNNKIENKYYGIKPSTLTGDELNKIVLKSFDEYKDKYFKKVPGKDQMYIDYILDERLDPSATWVDRKAATVSEAHGYGMLAITNAANMAPERLEELESIFKEFYNFFRAHPSDFSRDLMCWQMMGVGYNENGTGTLTDVINTSNGADSATDGDMDIAYALLSADNIWGSSGDINYRAEALKVIKAIYKLEVNKEENILLLGDWVLANNNIKYKTVTRSSDFMVNHLRLFASVDIENKEGWLKVLEQTETIIESNIKNWSKGTGLVADFIYKENGVYVPVKGEILEDVNDGDYNYNACRVPWRLSMDSLYSNETKLKDEIKVLNNWIINKTANNPAKIKPGYYVRGGTTGQPIPNRQYVDLSFVAPMAVSAALDSDSQQWLDELFIYLNRYSINEESYFANSLKLMAYFSISGNMVIPK